MTRVLLVAAMLLTACSGGDDAADEPVETARTDPFRIVGLFDPEPMELIACSDETIFPVRDSPEVVGLIELHQEMTPGDQPVELLFVEARVVGVEQGDDAWLDIREVYRAGYEGVDCPDPETPEPTALFSARGNEPFWTLDVGETSLTLTRPTEPDRTVPHGGVTGSEGAGWEVAAMVDDRELRLRMESGGCRDSMSGVYFHLTAAVAWGDQEWMGCAWRPVEDGPVE